ncbi:uncharacterized protein LOC117330448 isoform X2 [Pecten maximus]|uniref:uncharacterized protein LOC117330448 isoform X2 n=1 Tax=Pecten maximus TaxID=6579 RepID=UPI001458FE88|nr:uncharacterized protein LOC117330448 isoform X2 [Pecten maximus]
MDYTKILLEIIVFMLLPQGVWCYDKALLGIIASSVVAGVFFILIVVMAILVTIWEDIEIAKGKVKIPRHRYNRFRVHTPDSSISTDHTIEMTGVPIWAGVPPPAWREAESIPIPSDHSHAEDQVEREFYFTQRTSGESQHDPAVIISEPSEDHGHQTGYDYRGSSKRTSSSTNRLSASTNRHSGSTHRVSGATANTTLPSSARNNHGAYSAARLSNSNLSRAHSEVLLVPGSEMMMDSHHTGSIATLDRMTETHEKVTSF